MAEVHREGPALRECRLASYSHGEIAGHTGSDAGGWVEVVETEEVLSQ